MKKKFVKPSMKTIKMDLNVMQTGSGGGAAQGPDKISKGNPENGVPTYAESRKTTHITDNGYDY